MPKFELTYQVNYTETIYVDALSLTDALRKVDGDEPEVDLKVVTNLQYDAELVSINEVKQKNQSEDDLVMQLAIQNGVYSSDGDRFSDDAIHDNIVNLCSAYLKAKQGKV